MSEDRSSGGPPSGPRTMTQVTCSSCSKQTEVPFKPTSGRPVYCKECYQKKRDSGPPGRGRGRGGRMTGPPKKTRWARSEYLGYDPEKHAK